MAKIIAVHTGSQITEVMKLARRIWVDHYVPIIGREQVDYMLENFQSEAAITAQIADGQAYYLLQDAGENVGYLALIEVPESDQMMISKIYVDRACRGRGLGRVLLDFAEQRCRDRGLSRLWLTVNKQNRDAISWYTRMGFRNAGPVVQDIGGGFVMDDFCLEKPVGSPESSSSRGV